MRSVFIKLIERFKNRSLQFKFNIIYLAITLCVSILSGIFVYRLSSDAILDIFSGEARIRMDVFKKDADSQIEEVVYGLLGVVIRHREAEEENAKAEVPMSSRAIYYQSISELSNYDQVRYFFYNMNGNLQYTLSEDIGRYQASSRTEFYTDFLKSTRFRRVEPGVMTRSGSVVRIGHLSRAFSGIEEYVAYDYNTDRLDELYSDIDIAYGAYSFVVDGYGNIVSATDDSFLFKTEEQLEISTDEDETTRPQPVKLLLPSGNTVRCYSYKTDLFRFGWKYILLIPESTIFQRRNNITLTVILEPVIFCLLSFLIMLLFNSMFTKPLTKLTHAVDEAEPGSANISFHEKYNDEIGRLARSFKRKNKEIEQYIADIRKIEGQYIKAQYQAYQAQLNPHMLYNTFSTIIWLIENGRNEEAINALENLSVIMRAVMGKSESTSTVRYEMDLVTRYLQIQEYRYGDKFKKILLVDEDIMNCVIPSTILQPIVENAIYHGIKLLPGGGIIILRGYGEGDDLIFEVRDNGPVTEEAVEELNKRIRSDELRENSLGIRNVHLRLVYDYGSDYGVSVSKKDSYTVFRLRLKKN